MSTTDTTTDNAYIRNGCAPVMGMQLTRTIRPSGYYQMEVGAEYVVLGTCAVPITEVVGDRHGSKLHCENGDTLTIYVREETGAEKVLRIGREQTAAQKDPPTFDLTKRPEDYNDWD